MKYQDAVDKICMPVKQGFMVSFEWCGDGFLRSDHFPEKHDGEALIPTEEAAWILARKFAKAMKGKVCHLYVIDSNFSPVKDYKKRYIVNREEAK
jgi:hypothetical protein